MILVLSVLQGGNPETTAGQAPIVFTRAAGIYTTPRTIMLGESIPGSTIYYGACGIVNTNGFVPYTSPIPLTENGVASITACATETGYPESYSIPETYTINLPGGYQRSLAGPQTSRLIGLPLTVKGVGFTASSTVNWGSTALSTLYVSGTELTTQAPASAMANAGTATLMVQMPNVGRSNALMFEIDSAGSNTPPNFATSSASVSRDSSASYAATLPSSAKRHFGDLPEPSQRSNLRSCDPPSAVDRTQDQGGGMALVKPA